MRVDAEVGDDTSLHVVIAPNAFKGTLTAAQAAEAMRHGVLAAAPRATIDMRPVADGGDGSVDAFLRAGFQPHPTTTRGPTGHSVESLVALNGDLAVVGLADSCGMALLPGGRLEPMASSTLGLGDAVRAALDVGARRILVCIGGSASTDGGAGLLVALGARLLDARGREVPPSGARLIDVHTVDLRDLDARVGTTTLTVACDVDSPLAGPHGAAHVFAPQKGADPAQVHELDAGLRHWADLLQEAFGLDVAGIPGVGAAGGTGAALAALGAELRPGFGVIASAIGLPAAIARADAVVTGEGRLDEQSALGKGTAGVGGLARAAGVPALAVCGEITVDAERVGELGFVASADLCAIAGQGRARADAATVLAEATEHLLHGWLRG